MIIYFSFRHSAANWTNSFKLLRTWVQSTCLVRMNSNSQNWGRDCLLGKSIKVVTGPLQHTSVPPPPSTAIQITWFNILRSDVSWSWARGKSNSKASTSSRSLPFCNVIWLRPNMTICGTRPGTLGPIWISRPSCSLRPSSSLIWVKRKEIKCVLIEWMNDWIEVIPIFYKLVQSRIYGATSHLEVSWQLITVPFFPIYSKWLSTLYQQLKAFSSRLLSLKEVPCKILYDSSHCGSTMGSWLQSTKPSTKA